MATKEIYQARCGACGYIAGQVATPNAAIEATCPKCSKQKMAVKKAVIYEKTSLDYNVFVTCKQTNQTIKDGFTVNVEDREELAPVQLKNLFVERCAQTLMKMLSVQNVGKMVKEE